LAAEVEAEVALELQAEWALELELELELELMLGHLKAEVRTVVELSLTLRSSLGAPS
jgi:hypothetical protein